MLQERAEIHEINEQEPLLIGKFKGDIEHTFLNVVELQQSCRQHRSHSRNTGANRVAALPKKIPKYDRKFVCLIGNPNIFCSLHKMGLRVSPHGDACEIPFDIGSEHRAEMRRCAQSGRVERAIVNA